MGKMVWMIVLFFTFLMFVFYLKQMAIKSITVSALQIHLSAPTIIPLKVLVLGSPIAGTAGTIALKRAELNHSSSK